MPISNRGELHSNPESPDYWHPLYRDIEPTLVYLNDMYYGRRSWIDDEGLIVDSDKACYYLPKAEAQTDEQYVRQLRASVFRCFFREAIEKDFAPMLMDFDLNRKAKEFEEYFSDVDLLGNSLRVFLRQMVAKALCFGSAFCLVDMPRADFGEEMTLADTLGKSVRPYFIAYDRSQVINWRWVTLDSGPVLDMVVLKEEITKPEGTFGHKAYERYRVLHRDGRYQVYETEKVEDLLLFGENSDYNTSLDLVDEGRFDAEGIPLVGLSLTGSDPFTADFPLIEMADLTLDYYRVRSGYRVTLDYMEPTLFAKEQQDFSMNESKVGQSLNVGANSVLWNLEDVRWIEPEGGGILPKERCLERLEKQIDEMTISFFTGGAVAKTATEVRLDAAQSESTLADYAYHLESVVATMLKHFQSYLGLPVDGEATIVVNKALLKPPAAWTPRDILDWISMGAMSQELGYRIMHELNLLPEGITFREIDAELKKLTITPDVATEDELASREQPIEDEEESDDGEEEV